MRNMHLTSVLTAKESDYLLRSLKSFFFAISQIIRKLIEFEIPSETVNIKCKKSVYQVFR